MQLAEGVNLDFNIPQESRKGLVERIDAASDYVNPDGSSNYEAYVRDAYRTEFFDQIVAAAYQRGINDQLEKGAQDSQHLKEPQKPKPSAHESQYGIVGGYQDNRRRQV